MFHIRKMAFFSIWLVASGFLTLFLAEFIHPAVIVIITFGVGLIMMAVIVKLSSCSEGKR